MAIFSAELDIAHLSANSLMLRHSYCATRSRWGYKGKHSSILEHSLPTIHYTAFYDYYLSNYLFSLTLFISKKYLFMWAGP